MTHDPHRTPPHDAFDAWVADEARKSYHAPDAIPRDALWAAIRAARTTPVALVGADPRVLPLAPRRPAWAMRITALAAAVLLGVGLARVLDGPPQAPAAALADGAAASPTLVQAAIVEHLARSEALLTAARLSARSTAPTTDAELAAWARDLLTTTRLLRDARGTTDARLTVLLDDLELALAQLMQYQHSGRARDAAALRETLADRDLLTRLQGASAPPLPSRDDLPRTD